MIEIATILYLAGMSLALVGVDGYFSADTTRIEVTVHPAAQASGYTDEVAARYFDHELRRIFDVRSVMQVPHIRIQTDQSLISVIAKATRVDKLQYAMQDLLSLDPMMIRLVVYPPVPNRQHVVLQAFGSRPSGETFDVSIDGVPGDPRASLGAIAAATALAVDPYHVRLKEFRTLTAGAPLEAFRSRAPQSLPEDNWEAMRDFERRLAEALRTAPPSDALRSAPQFNLLGVTRWWLGNTSGAETAFLRSLELNESLATPRLNLAWALLARGDHAGAMAVMETVRPGLRDRIGNPNSRQTLTLAYRATTATAEQLAGRHTAAQRAWNEVCGTGVQPAFVALYVGTRSTSGQAAERCEAHARGMLKEEDLYEAIGMFSSELLIFAPRADASGFSESR